MGFSEIERFSTYFQLGAFEAADLFLPYVVDGRPVWSVLDPDYLQAYITQSFERGKFRRVSLWRRLTLRAKGVYSGGSDIFIGEGVTILPGAYIGNGVIIGDGCVIGQNAVLRGPMILGNGCKVGPCSEVKASIFLPHAAASHQNYVGDSILGRGVNLGAGVRIANLRLDRGEITVIGPEGKLHTGLRKFGAIIGDRCQIGCNAVLNPGTLLGKDCCAGPLVSVPSGYYSKGSVIRF